MEVKRSRDDIFWSIEIIVKSICVLNGAKLLLLLFICCVISVNGLWKEIPTRNWWTQSSNQKNAGEWEKGEEETCWGRCHQEDQQNGGENFWAVQKPSYTKTGIFMGVIRTVGTL